MSDSAASNAVVLWVYLQTSPLLHRLLTLSAYQLARELYRRSGENPLCNPVAIAILILISILRLTHTPYETYFEGAQFIHFLLGPTTVALAVPLYHQLTRLQNYAWPILIATVVGITTACLSATLIARWLGASPQTVLSIAPKSTTAPVAMAISKSIGGLPSLTAVLVISTGILGAVMGLKVLEMVGNRDEMVQGIALGVTSHGIGTARAFQSSPQMGAFSGLAMALSAGLASLLVPLLIGSGH